MGCTLGTIGCCFSSSTCSLCCSCCPSMRNSLITRLAYGILLLVGTIVSCVLLNPRIADLLHKIPVLCKTTTIAGIEILEEQIPCERIVGYLSIYRIQFSFACFFFLMMLVMLCVKRSTDPRSGIQNGFWIFKILLIIGICVGTFFIPNEGFAIALTIIGYICSFIFILIQFILLVDFVQSWNENWVGKGEDGSKKHFGGLIFFTAFFYISSIVAIILLYVYYASRVACVLNICFITINLILCLIVSVVSVLPAVQNFHSTSGLLQSSFVTVYIVFLTWSAMTGEKPDAICNPTLFGLAKQNSSPIADLTGNESINVTSIIALIMFFCLIIYSALISSTKSSNGKLIGIPTSEGTENTVSNVDGGTSYDDEEEGVAYNYSLFHLMLFFASFYIMTILTNWLKPASDFSSFHQSNAAVWIRIASSWTCVALYFWTIIAPCVLRNRDFS